MSTIQHLYDLYPKISQTSSKILPFQCRKSRIGRDKSLQKIVSPHKENSLVKQYSNILKNQSSQKLPSPSSHHPTHKHSFSYLQSSIEYKGAANNQHIESAINAVHNYSEEIKSTLSSKYKSKKKLSSILSQKQSQDKMSQKVIKQELDDNPQTIALKNPLITKYSNKSSAFKTINMLYKAIIDSSMNKKKKEDFQVTANRLPIIDRFNITKRMTKYREKTWDEKQRLFEERQKSNTLQPLELRHTKMTTLYRNTKLKFKEKGEKGETSGQVAVASVREDEDIVPWSIQEQQS